MDSNRKKYVGREFLQRLADTVSRAGTVEPVVMELASAPTDIRLDVAKGLLAIGADRLESVMRRKYALTILVVVARTCDLPNDEEMRGQLEGIVDTPLSGDVCDSPWVKPESQSDFADRQRLQKKALLALALIDRAFGLLKLNHVIAQYGDSKFARELCLMRHALFKDQCE